MKIIYELEELAFATRLKMLSERLFKDVIKVYSDLKVEFQPRWFTTMYSLYKHSPQSVTELAKSIGITHTAVNNTVSELANHQLIKKSTGVHDERTRMISISKNGKLTMDKLFPIFIEIKNSTIDLLKEHDPQLINTINKIELSLDKESLYERIWYKIKGNSPIEVKFYEYKPALKKHFIRLNKEWIREYFEIEDYDLKILHDPNRKIIKKGGMVYFAEMNSEYVGTCAVIPIVKGVYEIGKFGVETNSRNLGIGKKLFSKSIEFAINCDAKYIFIRTNKNLEIANKLYADFGFVIAKKNSPFNDNYNRETYTLMLKL